VRVNLIRSMLVFQEKKYCLHENAKLVFFFKYTKTIYTKKKEVHSNRASELHCSREQCNSLALFTGTMQFTYTVRANSASELHCAREHKFKKTTTSCFANFVFKT